MGSTTELCPKCGEPVGSHTVDQLHACLAPLYDHDLPFEELPADQQGEREIQKIPCGSLAVKAGSYRSPLGVHPVLQFEFSGPDGPLPPIMLILDDTHMRSVRTLVGSAIDAALKAARRAR